MKKRIALLWLLLCACLPVLAQEATATPEAPLSPEALDVSAWYGMALAGNEDVLRNNILLTIDDCYDEVLTRNTLDMLQARGITATFFPIGSVVKGHDPQLWRDIRAAGFEIGYHTMYHQEGMTVAQLNADFAEFTRTLRDVLDDQSFSVRYVRPPFGIWDKNWMAWAQANDLITVKWNLVTRRGLDMAYFEAVLRHADGGGIVLIHPRPTDVSWLERYLDSVQALTTSDGTPYRIVTLSEALTDDLAP